MSTHTYKYLSQLASEDKMFDDLKQLLQMNEIEGKLCNDLKLAVSEAFTNALVHGNKLDPKRKVEINITINNQFITADIIDEGFGEPARMLAEEDQDLWRERGRGVILMETVADRVTFSRDHVTGGLQCTLLFDRERYINENKAAAAGSRAGG
jgi:serine/threonine-protein kinase RsbW